MSIIVSVGDKKAFGSWCVIIHNGESEDIVIPITKKQAEKLVEAGYPVQG